MGQHRKRRTREHVIADLSVNHVERMVLRADFVVQKCQNDYGIDLEVYTFAKNGEVEPGLVYIQVKATDHILRMRRGRHLAISTDERDVRAWAMQRHPVLLILYDAKGDRAYWIHVQEWVRSPQTEATSALRAYRTIRIPMKNRWNELAMMKMAEEKNIMYQAQ